jgi:hypothetical protein
MKNKLNALNVDFIGGQAPLTQAEESALSDFFKHKKIKIEAKKNKSQNNTSKRKLEKA